MLLRGGGIAALGLGEALGLLLEIGGPLALEGLEEVACGGRLDEADIARLRGPQANRLALAA